MYECPSCATHMLLLPYAIGYRVLLSVKLSLIVFLEPPIDPRRPSRIGEKQKEKVRRQGAPKVTFNLTSSVAVSVLGQFHV